MNIITAEVNHSVVGVVPFAQKATQLLKQVLDTKMKKHIDEDNCQHLRARLTSLTKHKAEEQQQESPKHEADDQQQDKPNNKPRPSTRASEAA